MFEPLAIGRWTLKAEVSDDSSTRKRSGGSGAKSARGSRAARVMAPSAMTVMVNQRAPGGRSLSRTLQV